MVKGITFSAFDLLHAGHVVMLEEAKTQCDWLIVGLHHDPSLGRPHKNRPAQSLLERQLQLRACKYVDEIVVYENEQDLVDILYIWQPQVRILGEEYRHQEFSGKTTCEQLGVRLYYNQRQHHWSSSSLRKQIAHQEFLRFNQQLTHPQPQ